MQSGVGELDRMNRSAMASVIIGQPIHEEPKYLLLCISPLKNQEKLNQVPDIRNCIATQHPLLESFVTIKRHFYDDIFSNSKD